MKKIALIIFLGIILLSGCVQVDSAQVAPRGNEAQGKNVQKMIESPHPYPVGESQASLVWSYTITHPTATFYRIHFKNVDVQPAATAIINKGETTIQGWNSVSGLEYYYVNNFSETSQTLQERTNNIRGDYLVLKDKDGNIQMIVMGTCPSASDVTGSICNSDGFWTGDLFGDTIKIELYADNSESGNGVIIDQYFYGEQKFQ